MRGIPAAGDLRRLAINVRSGFWFMPVVLVLVAVALALVLVEVDQRLDPALWRRWPHLFPSGAEGARAMLSTIAGSMITVAGVVFSITIVALSQASTQYTSRVLRNFMRDRVNQAVLGVFLGVFTYCVIVLRTISGSDGDWDGFVPVVAVSAGLLLALVAIGFLIAFIHHIATTIQAGEIARTVMEETLRAIDRLFPDVVGKPAQARPQADPDACWRPVPSNATGYVQSVLPDALLAFAIRYDTVVRMEVGIGGFVARGRTLASLALPAEPGPRLVDELNALFAIDSYRTTDQDPVFGFRQLVDIALKALSPSINDSTTAITCLDYLSVCLERVAQRSQESPCRSEDSHLRVIARGPDFHGFVDLATGQILENARGNTVVLVRMLRMLEEVAAAVRQPERRQALVDRVEVIAEVALANAAGSHARAVLEARIACARLACAADAEAGFARPPHP